MKKVKRIVDTGFWCDDKVLDFSPEDKYFMLFLLTNEYTSQLGIYHLPIKKASADLGYSQDSVKVLLERFENKYGIIKYSTETSEVAIKNYLLYSIVSGGKPVLDCLLKEMDAVKDTNLLKAVYSNLTQKPIKNETVKRFLSLLNDYLKNINVNKDNDNDNERYVDDSLTIRSLKFTPPTLEEIEAYCKERNNKVNPKAFFDYFTEGKWKDSKGNPVKNWKQKIITWEKFEPKDKPKKENQFNQMIHTNYDFDEIERKILQ
jgi:hypothetical protein